MTFVCWKWGAEFAAKHVNVLRAMLARHYHGPHELVCITDDVEGLDPRIRTHPCPVHFEGLQNPDGERFPSCYRRLWNFSAEAAEVLGPRFLAIDVDVIVTGDITDLMDRQTASFVGWTDVRFKWRKVAGGIYMLAGAKHRDVWETFDPYTSPQLAAAAGCHGSDQGWISLCMYPPPAAFTARDGVVSLKWLRPGLLDPPRSVRIVSTPGKYNPWNRELQSRYSWIRKHWTL